MISSLKEYQNPNISSSILKKYHSQLVESTTLLINLINAMGEPLKKMMIGTSGEIN